MTPREKLAKVLQAEGVRLWREGIELIRQAPAEGEEELAACDVRQVCELEAVQALEHAEALEALAARLDRGAATSQA